MRAHGCVWCHRFVRRKRSCVCVCAVKTPVTDGDSGTPMERMKDGRTAEDAPLNVPHVFFFFFSLFHTLSEVSLKQHK